METKFVKDKNLYLVVGGILSIAAAFLHIAIIVGGSSWYRFFGAGEEMATMAEQGSWVPGIVTLGIAIVLFIWGLYAFSGAKVLNQLPFIKPVLVLVSVIYLVRGLGLIPAFIIMPERVDAFLVWSSLVSLIFGLSYAIGTKQEWSSLSAKNT
jgi:hypothetical protein